GGQLGFFGGHGQAHLSDPGLAVLARDMPAQKNEVAGLHKRHIRSGGHRNGWQNNAKGGEAVVNAHEWLLKKDRFILSTWQAAMVGRDVRRTFHQLESWRRSGAF